MLSVRPQPVDRNVGQAAADNSRSTESVSFRVHRQSGILILLLFLGWSLSGAASGQQRRPDNLTDQFRLAAGHYQRQQWSEAAVAFERLIESAPDSTEAQQSRFYQGEAYVQLVDYRSAFAAFDKYLSGQPSAELAKRARFRRAEAAFFSQEGQASRRWLRQFADAFPSDPLQEFALSYLGEAELQCGDHQLAAKSLQQCLNQFPESSRAGRNQLNLAHCYRLLDQPDRALDMLAQYGQRSPAAAWESHLARGHLLFGIGRFPAAETEYQSALEYQQHVPSEQYHEIGECRYWLARCAMQRQDWQQATESLTGLAHSTGWSNELRARASYDAALCQIRLDEFESANQWLTSIETDFPESTLRAEAACLRVELAAQNENYAQVLELAALAREHCAAPERQHHLAHQTAVAQYQLGQYKECAATCRDLISALDSGSLPATLNSQRVLWHYLAAASQIGLGEYELADAMLNRIDRLPDVGDPLRKTWQQHLLLARATVDTALDRHDQVIASLLSYLETADASTATPTAPQATATTRTEIETGTSATGSSVTVPALPASAVIRRPHGDTLGSDEPLSRVVRRNLILACCRAKKLLLADRLLEEDWPGMQQQPASWDELLVCVQLAQTAARTAAEFADRTPSEKTHSRESDSSVAATPHQALAQKWLQRSGNLADEWLRQSISDPDSLPVATETIQRTWQDIHVELYRLFMSRQQWPAAHQLSRHLLSVEPANPATAFAVLESAKQLIRSERAGQASLLLEALAKDTAPAADAHELALWRGRAFLGLASEARQQVATGLTPTTDATEWTARARSVFSAALTDATDPTHPAQARLWYELAWLEQTAGNLAAAARAFEQIEQRHTASPLRHDSLLRLALIYLEQQRFEEAARAARLLIESQPSQSRMIDHGYLLRGRSLLELDKIPAAQHALTVCFRRTGNPEFRESAAHWLCQAIIAAPDVDEALESFYRSQTGLSDTAQELVPRMELQIAQHLADAGEIQQAGKIAERALSRFNDFEYRYEFDYIAGRALAERGEFHLARDRYQQVVESATGESTETAAKAQWMIGESYFHQEKYAEAIDAYYRVDSLYDYNDWRGWALLQAAKCQLKLGNKEIALRLAQRALDFTPPSAAAEPARQWIESIQ